MPMPTLDHDLIQRLIPWVRAQRILYVDDKVALWMDCPIHLQRFSTRVTEPFDYVATSYVIYGKARRYQDINDAVHYSFDGFLRQFGRLPDPEVDRFTLLWYDRGQKTTWEDMDGLNVMPYRDPAHRLVYLFPLFDYSPKTLLKTMPETLYPLPPEHNEPFIRFGSGEHMVDLSLTEYRHLLAQLDNGFIPICKPEHTEFRQALAHELAIWLRNLAEKSREG